YMFEKFANWLVYGVFGIDPASRLGASFHFFIYDSVKILVLILFVVFLISFLRTFFPAHKIKKLLSREKWGISNFIAAFFGAISPFCSCSSIPLFLGFIEAEVPLGVAFSFLITSPLVNEVVFVIMGGMFGWKLAFIYALTGILLGVIGGMALGRLKMEDQLLVGEGRTIKEQYLPQTFSGKIEYSFRESISVFKRLFIFVVVGVGLGAFIHGYIPQEIFTQYIKADNIFAVPIAVLVGVPIYAGCSTLVPVVFAITTKGVPLGTALAFMMSVAGLSLPEALILKGAMKMRLLAAFFAMVSFGIILVGYLFNFLL
ncbi:MAG: permease, partial [Candidatus Margulisiibacteriota bacterium]